LFVGYSFGRSPGSGAGPASRLLDGLSMQLGVRNVFDKVAPLDVGYSNNYYMSPYGEVRLRSYWLNVRLSFD
jgi:outer membrane receptor protein involved in Fe transport